MTSEKRYGALCALFDVGCRHCAAFFMSGGGCALPDLRECRPGKRQRHRQFTELLHTRRTLGRLDLFEEVVTFVIHEDERREVFHFNFPDRFHTQFRVLHALKALDTALRQHRCRAAYAAEVEAAVLMAGVGDLLALTSVPCGLRLPFASMIMLPPLACNWST